MARNFFLWFAFVKLFVLTVACVIYVRADAAIGSTTANLSESEPVAEVSTSKSTDATTLVQEQAEQNTRAVAQNVEENLFPEFGSYYEDYEGLAAFSGDDIISNFFANIGQLICKWLSDFVGWVLAEVQVFMGILHIFVLLRMLCPDIRGWVHFL